MAVMYEKRKRMLRALLIVLCILILIGVTLIVYLLNSDRSIINVVIGGEEAVPVRFERLGLSPGEKCGYTVRLGSDTRTAYTVTLEFRDLDPTLTLKQFAFVRVETEGDVICDGMLSDVFSAGEYILTVDLSDGARHDIAVTYYMPEEVGNEAQNAEASFELLITANIK